MAVPNPLVLSETTRFRPLSFRGHSRSPSRSPVRKSLFLAKEIDPLLSNLSPDSTLKALQATSTIVHRGPGQDALAKSIADALPEEREVGIRAAVAAQKLRQWRQELESWPWPSIRERSQGAGFLPPAVGSTPLSTGTAPAYVGCLPAASVKLYQDRIEDIRDGVEALELEDIKDHIFSAHVSQTQLSTDATSNSSSPITPTFGKMRDFTALITATVVQALPDLAHLNLSLDTWDVRLLVLRQTSDIENMISGLKVYLDKAKALLQEPGENPAAGMEDVKHLRILISQALSSLGTKIDQLLDRLEDQQDTLPQSWIDSLESMEDDFATWAVAAERFVTAQQSVNDARNGDIIPVTNNSQEVTRSGVADDAEKAHSNSETIPVIFMADSSPSGINTQRVGNTAAVSVPKDFPLASTRTAPSSMMHVRKPTLTVEPYTQNHRRGVSEVSMADSAFSGMSDISSAEIIDVRKTQVLASPKISVVQNSFRASRDELSWLVPSDATDHADNLTKPVVLHRASTATIQLISKDAVRPVTLTRSQSFDLLGSNRYSAMGTPSYALRQLIGADMESPVGNEAASVAESNPDLAAEEVADVSAVATSSNELVAVTKEHAQAEILTSRPRRSSSGFGGLLCADNTTASSSTIDSIEPRTPTEPSHAQQPVITVTATSPSRRSILSIRESKSESLEDKIKDILVTMPTKIRLANSSSSMFSFSRSLPTTRSSTPVPTLTISPVKPDRSGRKATPGDVRLFHLTRSGQARDTPPVKLFVRAVGENGERVMVRVGGGWADLGEYLREYSLHHGHRGLKDGQLEVANLPTDSAKKSLRPNNVQMSTASTLTRPSSSADSSTKRRFSLSSLSTLAVGKTRKNGGRAKSFGPDDALTPDAGMIPPVPMIPHSFTTLSPTTTTGTTNSTTHTKTLHAPTYTPLGAAGPKSGTRRARASDIGVQHETWVEGMVGKARAVSGGGATFHSSSGTTSTTPARVAPGSGSSDRHLSSQTIMTPVSHVGTANAHAPAFRSNPDLLTRPKSRMSLADVSGIKRVFLRRKSEK